MGNIVQTSGSESVPLGKTTYYVVATVALAFIVRLVLQIIQQSRRRLRLEKILADQKIPGPPLHWFWGNAGAVKVPSDSIRLAYEETKQYGAVRRGRTGPFRCMVTLSTPETIKAVMNKSDPKDPLINGFFRPWIGDGLLLSYGEKWQRNRRLLTPAFHFEILKPYMKLFFTSAQVLIMKWKQELAGKEGRLEMFHHVSLMMLDSILKCAFGYESNCQTEGGKSPYVQAVYDLSALIVKRINSPMMHIPLVFYLSPYGFKFRKACSVVHNFSKNVIKARKEEQEEVQNEKKYLDFLDILLKAKSEDGRGLTDEEIQHEVDTFMFEGHDTTASGLSWFLYNMARFPQHQQKCRQEVQDLLGEGDEISWDDLSKMTYLTMCIKESLRIHPPVPGIARRVNEDVKLPNGITLPAGMRALLSIFGMQHNAEVWPDPETFDPLRFTPENSKDRSTHAFVPFSAGPRNCIGQNFAMHELKVTAALLLKNFSFTLDESVPIVLWPELILRSKDGIWLKVTPLT